MRKLLAPTLIVLGALVMLTLWPLFTVLHGPTSFNLDRHFLGFSPLFWGALMEGVSGVLITIGVVLWRRVFIVGALSRVALIVALVALAVPAMLDLAFLVTMPPLVQPLLGLGLIAIAAANRELPTLARLTLATMGALYVAALWSLFVSIEQWDSLNGYRVYGIMANVLPSIGWIIVAVSVALAARRAALSLAAPSRLQRSAE